MIDDHSTILFYDGDCGLCNRVVQFVLRHERKNELFFTTLDSDFARTFFQERTGILPKNDTVILYSNYLLYERSSAVIELLSYLKFPFPLLKLFRILPVCWRDYLYNLVAKNRKRLFSNFCKVPDSETLNRFIP